MFEWTVTDSEWRKYFSLLSRVVLLFCRSSSHPLEPWSNLSLFPPGPPRSLKIQIRFLLRSVASNDSTHRVLHCHLVSGSSHTDGDGLESRCYVLSPLNSLCLTRCPATVRYQEVWNSVTRRCAVHRLCSCWVSLLTLFPVDVKDAAPLEIESPCLGEHCHLITHSLAVVSSLICRPCLLSLIAFHCWKEVPCYKGVSENAFGIKELLLLSV